MSISNDLLSILVAHRNANGKIIDEVICREIAAYLNGLAFPNYYGEALWEFIYEYGEEEDDRYMGRDENGEKQYISYNRETNWHARIDKELAALGFYARYDVWAAQQKRVAA
jgi:hypothetical protein